MFRAGRSMRAVSMMPDISLSSEKNVGHGAGTGRESGSPLCRSCEQYNTIARPRQPFPRKNRKKPTRETKGPGRVRRDGMLTGRALRAV